MLKTSHKESFELQKIENFDPEGGQMVSPSEWKPLKVVCVVVSAMGHFIPILNCAKALK